jgi:hypothetical protein
VLLVGAESAPTSLLMQEQRMVGWLWLALCCWCVLLVCVAGVCLHCLAVAAAAAAAAAVIAAVGVRDCRHSSLLLQSDAPRLLRRKRCVRVGHVGPGLC